MAVLIGDLSYSANLLHFPSTFVTVALLPSLQVTDAPFSAPWFRGSFFAMLMPISWLSYRYIELPPHQRLSERERRGSALAVAVPSEAGIRAS